MNWWDEFPSAIRRGVPLAGYTTFGIGGPAEFFAEPRSIAELGRLIRRCHEEGLPVRLLGKGSNLLVQEAGVAGLVVRLPAPQFSHVEVSGNRLTAGAGCRLEAMISHTVRRGLRGLECLSGIPGTVGGAVRGNAGTPLAEISGAITAMTLMGPTGTIYDLPADQAGFGYRRSNLGGWIILAATFQLEEESSESVAQRRRVCFQAKRRRQPLAARSAGCVFKNPPENSASFFIDRAGLKGTRVGGARVSDVHANYVIADLGTISCDVLCLMAIMRRRVQDQFGIVLEPEIVVW